METTRCVVNFAKTLLVDKTCVGALRQLYETNWVGIPLTPRYRGSKISYNFKSRMLVVADQDGKELPFCPYLGRKILNL